MRHAGNPKALLRFRDDPGLDADDERLHRLFRALPAVEAFTSVELARAARSLNQPSARTQAKLRPQALLILAAALAGAGVAAAGLGVASVWPTAPSHESHEETAPAKAAAPAAARGRHSAPRSGPEAAVELTPAPSASVPALAFRAESPLQAKPAPSSGSTANLELARESELLQQALVTLRQQGDARGALALLDRYQREFPQGKLALEARVTRIDALLRTSERASALTLLEGLPFERLGRGDELRVLRAELRAERDCSHALPEFDALIGLPLAGALAERSLYGRAACRLQLGDEAGGKADLARYQQRYPQGRFAERARARLGSR